MEGDVGVKLLAEPTARASTLSRRDHATFLVVARRWTRSPDEAEDLVQIALTLRIESGHRDLSSVEARNWLAGTIRNLALAEARRAGRRRARDGRWGQERVEIDTNVSVFEAGNPWSPWREVASELPPSLRSVLLLALIGATRAEIRYLLNLSDTALRQRLAGLRRMLRHSGAPPPPEPALAGTLPFGLLRRHLITAIGAAGGQLGSHDPDGHLFLVTGSQKAGRRQLISTNSQGDH